MTSCGLIIFGNFIFIGSFTQLSISFFHPTAATASFYASTSVISFTNKPQPIQTLTWVKNIYYMSWVVFWFWILRNLDTTKFADASICTRWLCTLCYNKTFANRSCLVNLPATASPKRPWRENKIFKLRLGEKQKSWGPEANSIPETLRSLKLEPMPTTRPS